jgi:methyl-accepting chemotaxis protein
MGSSIEEVARSAGALHDSADATTTSVHQMSASISQVAESADAVQGMAEESAAAMVEMDRAIQQVSQHVGEAAQLTEQVNSGAQEGSRAVSATIEGIDEIRRQTLAARTVLERLAERIGEIGEIVDVIGSINEETNLLSLNAAIIAAQAGEQGKAFAVVANHVKTLAQRTASSTNEIEKLIGAVQSESHNAVSAMGAGIEAVEAGVSRSRTAGQELDGIRDVAREASLRVAEISRATAEQSRNSKHVTEAAQRTSAMVQQITGAMGEQTSASQSMLRNSESALDLCGQVHRSSAEQRESARFITASIQAISEMIRSIQNNTESHGAASEQVGDAVDRILQVAKRGMGDSRELLERLEQLQRQAADLGATPAAGD